MLTLLASLIGFFSSSVPHVLQLWRDRSDRQYQLAVLDRQIQAQRQSHQQQIETLQTQASIAENKALYRHASQPSGVKWVEALARLGAPNFNLRFFHAIRHSQNCHAAEIVGAGLRVNRWPNLGLG